MGELERAIEAFERYLILAPDAPDRATVEERIASLRAIVDKRQERSSPPAPVAPAARSARSDAPAQPPPDREPDASPPAPIAPWIVMSAGLATLGAGSIVALLATMERDSAEEEPIQERAGESFRDAERMATAANVLFGVGGAIAAAGFAWGIVAVYTQTEERAGALRVIVGPSSAALRLTF
jgi:hypothetical protein